MNRKVDSQTIPYHHISIGCHNCGRCLFSIDTNDWYDLEYQRILNMVYNKNFCDDKCKQKYMLKKMEEA